MVDLNKDLLTLEHQMYISLFLLGVKRRLFLFVNSKKNSKYPNFYSGLLPGLFLELISNSFRPFSESSPNAGFRWLSLEIYFRR